MISTAQIDGPNLIKLFKNDLKDICQCLFSLVLKI